MLLRRVRLAALSDRPEAFRSDHATESAFTRDVWADRAAKSSAGTEIATFFAERHGEVIGLVTGVHSETMSGGHVELTSMWSEPIQRRTGIGGLLVDAVVEWAAAVGAEAVELWVMRGNDSAQRLYQRREFVVLDSVLVADDDPCRNEIRMRRPL